MNEPPIRKETGTQSRFSRLAFFLAIACAAFASLYLFWAFKRARRPRGEVAQSSREPALTRAGLASANRDLAEEPERPEEDEVGKTFRGLRQLFDYYETKGFIMLGRFEKSRWPAKVVQQEERTNEISFTLKGGVRHSYPGYTGYRLRVVTLADATGGETVVVLRSKDKVKAEEERPNHRPH